jgi:hypothetical protein
VNSLKPRNAESFMNNLPRCFLFILAQRGGTAAKTGFSVHSVP